jgi:hypothetical protein
LHPFPFADFFQQCLAHRFQIALHIGLVGQPGGAPFCQHQFEIGGNLFDQAAPGFLGAFFEFVVSM